ncbi:hypothetical protein WMY93_005273 [Mugilogobius chulae]|uniref:Uncharacterized protein n=1 Tax=Mugilogobius chulae TaxID=88201 RepID=A0AAW0PS23_9GOBI
MAQDQHISEMFTVQGMRKFVCDRLTEAAQEILGVFEKRAQEYELELARQRKLLERVYCQDNFGQTGPAIKEEQDVVSITDIQHPPSSTSLQSSDAKKVQNADGIEQKRPCTPHQETEVPSLTNKCRHLQKTKATSSYFKRFTPALRGAFEVLIKACKKWENGACQDAGPSSCAAEV